MFLLQKNIERVSHFVDGRSPETPPRYFTLRLARIRQKQQLAESNILTFSTTAKKNINWDGRPT